jgi:hypothetical protein
MYLQETRMENSSYSVSGITEHTIEPMPLGLPLHELNSSEQQYKTRATNN